MNRPLLSLFLLMIIPWQQVCAQTATDNFRQLQKAFLQHPSDYTNYQNLHTLLSSQYGLLSAGQRNEIRQLLNQSAFSKIKNFPATEPGTRIVISGTVTDKNAKPVAGAKIIVFQTDASGNYAPQDSKTKRMSESDARLYGVLHTDSQGRYELQAIHPGSYPFKYEGRFIPQHIHFNVSAAGIPELRLQLTFEDDPAMMDSHWQKWAKAAGFPIIKLISVNGIPTGVCHIELK